MVHNGKIEALVRTLQDIRSNNHLMGGITILLTGDRKILPVVPRKTRADEVRPALNHPNYDLRYMCNPYEST